MEQQSPAKSKKWLIFRLAFVAFFATSGPTFAAGTAGPPVWPILITGLVAFFFTVSHLRTEVRRQPDRRDWSPPTWFTNPFTGPAQGFHVASLGSLGLGAAALGCALYRHRPLAIPLFPLVVGLGIYIGLRVFYGYFYDGTPKA